ncbi:hypothetical protein [Niabella sp.]|uniref:hypothetical protein n=1 Tax=Niabella sp. TaxID=1962976 RepID=UPI00263062C4|nr:hypothetical protein [Niabella sp.]
MTKAEYFTKLKESMEVKGAIFIKSYDGVIYFVIKKGNTHPEFRFIKDQYKTLLDLELKIEEEDDDIRLFWSAVPMTPGDRWQAEAGNFLFLAEVDGLKIVDRANNYDEDKIKTDSLGEAKDKAQEYWDNHNSADNGRTRGPGGKAGSSENEN